MLGWLTSLFSKNEYEHKKKVYATKKQKEDMKNMRAEGHTIGVIAKQFNVSYSTAFRVTRGIK